MQYEIKLTIDADPSRAAVIYSEIHNAIKASRASFSLFSFGIDRLGFMTPARGEFVSLVESPESPAEVCPHCKRLNDGDADADHNDVAQALARDSQGRLLWVDVCHVNTPRSSVE